MIELPFSPIERAEFAEKIATSGLKRKYYRFRPAPYYGGIATADTIGCCFLCAYCWNYKRNLNPQNFGKFYSPQEVVHKLLDIAKGKNFRYLRLTGAEPILGKTTFNHFLKIAHLILEKNSHLTFILETNGLILGYYPDLIKEIDLKHLSIRIAFKGWDERSFERITGAKGEYFIYPLMALKNLQNFGLEAWPAVMEDFFNQEKIDILKEKMRKLGIIGRMETEILERYPYCIENIKNRGLELNT